MDRFPNASESVAASALLLLSSHCQLCVVKEKEPLLLGKQSVQSADVVDSFLSTHSKSSTASMITDDSSPEEIKRRRIRSIVARSREMRLKVARKSHSKGYLICNMKHNNSTDVAKAVAASSESAQDAVSEVSSLSVCSEPSHEEITLKKKVDHGHLWRLAEAILRFLESGGCASEVRIRHVLGDNPDTSKALRILLKLEDLTLRWWRTFRSLHLPGNDNQTLYLTSRGKGRSQVGWN